MNNDKMTGWYPADTQPAKTGLYQVLWYRDRPSWCWWNGTQWGDSFCADTFDTSAYSACSYGIQFKNTKQDMKWRGLKNET